MVLVNVNLNYSAMVNNNASVDIDGVNTSYPLGPGDQALLVDAVNAMQAEDVTNKGWLIESDKVADEIVINFFKNIDPNVTTSDKGTYVDSLSPVFTDLNAIVVSILDVLIP